MSDKIDQGRVAKMFCGLFAAPLLSSAYLFACSSSGQTGLGVQAPPTSGAAAVSASPGQAGAGAGAMPPAAAGSGMTQSGAGRAARRGSGPVIELECGITVYPAREENGRWRAVWHENGERQQCEAASEEKLAARLAKVAERHPGLQLIADHMGMSLSDENVRAGKFDGAVGDVLALAKFPNVSVKLSGTPQYSRQPYPYADLNPYIRRLFEAYGPQRSYWGTDITNGGFEKATYRQRIAHFTEALDFMSEDDRDWVMGRGILARLKWG